MRGTTPELRRRARELRWSMTPAEQVLWEAIKGRQLAGLRFRAQHPVGRFILDFYCPAHKLVIEADGGVHDQRAGRDDARTAELNAFGYRVLRFPNEEIMHNLPTVLNRIRATVASPAVLPPELGGRGGDVRGGDVRGGDVRGGDVRAVEGRPDTVRVP